jgi:hypothetical protein
MGQFDDCFVIPQRTEKRDDHTVVGSFYISAIKE